MEELQRARYLGRGTELPCALRGCHFPSTSTVHQPGSSLNPVLLGFLWRHHHTGMTDQSHHFHLHSPLTFRGYSPYMSDWSEELFYQRFTFSPITPCHAHTNTSFWLYTLHVDFPSRQRKAVRLWSKVETSLSSPRCQDVDNNIVSALNYFIFWCSQGHWIEINYRC